jgi:hypothetical protein
MAAPARTLVTDLPKGHQFPTTTFSFTSDDLARYLDAVGDTNTVYVDRGLAPPLAVAARALGALLEVIELPAATLHTGQEVEAHEGVPLGATLSLSGRIAQRSERAGMVISIIEFDVTPEGSEHAAVSGRSTVMVQVAS